MRTLTHHYRQFRNGTHPAVWGSRLGLLSVTVVFGLLSVTGRLPGLETQLVVYLVGMVALNLPHGGYEHFENLRRRGLPFGARYVLLYLSAIAGFVLLFFLAPLLALGIGFATAVAKGGHGDLRVMDALVGSDHLDGRWRRALAALVRGGAVMVVPLVFWPDTYAAFSGYMLSMFDPGSVGLLFERLDAARLPLGGLYAVGLVTHLALGYATDGASTAWLADLGETALLVTYFAVVPVVVSIGLYFPLWYSLRQSGRAAAIREAEPEGLPVPVVWGVLVAGAFATATVAALLWLVAPNPLGTATLLPGLVAFYTVFICIVALPHVVVGEWLDGDRGIWYVP
jgi:Brp/Blh family beta-carotene 15,15'-monooxygenase